MLRQSFICDIWTGRDGGGSVPELKWVPAQVPANKKHDCLLIFIIKAIMSPWSGKSVWIILQLSFYGVSGPREGWDMIPELKWVLAHGQAKNKEECWLKFCTIVTIILANRLGSLLDQHFLWYLAWIKTDHMDQDWARTTFVWDEKALIQYSWSPCLCRVG